MNGANDLHLNDGFMSGTEGLDLDNKFLNAVNDFVSADEMVDKFVNTGKVVDKSADDENLERKLCNKRASSFQSQSNSPDEFRKSRFDLSDEFSKVYEFGENDCEGLAISLDEFSVDEFNEVSDSGCNQVSKTTSAEKQFDVWFCERCMNFHIKTATGILTLEADEFSEVVLKMLDCYQQQFLQGIANKILGF